MIQAPPRSRRVMLRRLTWASCLLSGLLFNRPCFRLVGLCLLQNELCPIFLSRHVMKYILGRKVGWHDFAFFDPIMYESLRQLVLDAENNSTNKDPSSSGMFAALDLTFNIDLCNEEVTPKVLSLSIVDFL